jgi:two-component system chemotaxis response regulator CheY
MALNVLIADDSATMRAVIAKALRLSGLQLDKVYEAPDGRGALEILESHEIHLVFTDLNMPGLNGEALLAAMRSRPESAGIPVVMVSSDGSAARMARCKAQGLAAYVRKPFTPESICQAAHGALRT